MFNDKRFPSLKRTHKTSNLKPAPILLKRERSTSPLLSSALEKQERETTPKMSFFTSLPITTPNYRNGLKHSSQIKFPSTFSYTGFHTPSRFEGEISDLEVSGSIPLDISGTFFRIQPDHRLPPLYEEDNHLNGDGSVSSFELRNGHVDFRQRYVRTDRFMQEKKARRALFGRYGNVYTDHESVKGVIRTTANCNVVFWRGMLLALKEDGPPFALDPETLETIGRYDFEGQVTSPTFTAHPKIDLETGEMIAFACEAGGNGADASREIVVFTIDKEGRKIEECWYKAPFCGMVHDCGVSENYVVLPLTPLKASLSRLKRGGNHFAWDPEEDMLFGIVPRRGGRPEDIVWLRANNGFQGHVAGCYENEEGKIVLDITVAKDNVCFFFPPEGSPPESPEKRIKQKFDTFRWILDPKAKTDSRVKLYKVFGTSGEYSRIDDRLITKKYNHFWQPQIDLTKPYDFEGCGLPPAGLFNTLGHFMVDGKTNDSYWAGPTTTFQEPAFVPKNAGVEGEGYIMVLLNYLDELRNDLLIFEAQHLADGPLAAIHLPFKLRLGLHGTYVNRRELDAWKEPRKPNGELGPVRPAENPLPWQIDLAKKTMWASNGGSSWW